MVGNGRWAGEKARIAPRGHRGSADRAAEVDASGEIVLAVIRDDVVHRFDTSDIRILQKGDQLVVIRHTESNGYSVTLPPES